jgi:hypothetical protein
MITFEEIVEYCKAEALAGKLFPTEASNWRWFCREYSKAFHTPLHEVLTMDPEHVILFVFEDNFDNKRLKKKEDLDSIILELRRLEDPNYDEKEAKQFDDWTAGIEEWEEERQRTGAPLPTKAGSKNPKPIPKPLPKEGGINLAYLSQEQENDPDNGF